MKVIENLKRGLSYSLDKLVNNLNYVYTFLILIIINVFIWLNVGIKHSAEMLKSKGENAILILELNQSKIFLEESSKAFDWQWDIIRKQREQLDKAEQIMQNQETVLNQLIRYLKETKQWPPKIKPIDPNNLAISDSI